MKKALFTMFVYGFFILSLGGLKAHAGWYTDYSSPAWYPNSSYNNGYNTNYSNYNNYNYGSTYGSNYNSYNYGNYNSNYNYPSSYNNSYNYGSNYNYGGCTSLCNNSNYGYTMPTYTNSYLPCSCIQAVACPCTSNVYGTNGYNTGYNNSYYGNSYGYPYNNINISANTYSPYSYSNYSPYGYGNTGMNAGIGISYSW